MAKLVKNPPAMQATLARFLGRENPLEEGKENPLANAGDVRDTGLIPGLGRAPGEWKGYPLQDSGLENSMDKGVALKSRTRLSD